MPDNIVPHITPVILAGGKGTRLWPLTGPDRPKPFLRPFSRYSLLQETMMRVRDFAAPLLITEGRNLTAARHDAAEIGASPSFVLEPSGRGTAAALMLAAMVLRGARAEGLMLVMPSDHVIPDREAAFPAFIQSMAPHAQNGVVQAGVMPSGPQTRYGYIEVIRDACLPYKVTGFVEKPPAAKARALLRKGKCFWNSGIFLTSPSSFLALCEAARPNLYRAVQAAFTGCSFEEGGLFRPDPGAYGVAEVISVDHAILPHCKDLKCCPLPLPWYDTGCWSTFLYLKTRRLIKGRL